MPRGAAAAARVPLYIPALLIAASAVSILSTDLYTPSLPHLQGYFSADAEAVQLTMSLNLLGFALAQLVYGPLSDRFGRRPILLGGMLGFALSTLACVLAPDLESLIAARVLQGVTACTEVVVGYAVIRELYDEAGAVKVLGAYGMAVALAPAVGPLIGGLMHVSFGWRSNFVLLLGLIVLVTLLIWRYLPETLAQPDREATQPRKILAGYAALLRNGAYMTYALILGGTMAALFAFVTEGPFLFIEGLGVATESYGYYYAAIVLAYFVGAMAANRAAGRLPVDGIAFAGLLLCALGPAVLIGLTALDLVGGLTFTAALSAFALGLGLIFASAPVRAFDVCTAGRGLAAALLGALEIGCAGLGALLVAWLHDGSAWALSLTMALCTFGPLLAYLVLRPWRFAAAETGP